MSRRPRRNYAAAFRAKGALAAIRGDKTRPEPSSQFHVHPNQITQWKNVLSPRRAAQATRSLKFAWWVRRVWRPDFLHR